ncbi:MAG: hypothetical protein ACRDTV_17565 [Mycobacterium sp.]
MFLSVGHVVDVICAVEHGIVSGLRHEKSRVVTTRLFLVLLKAGVAKPAMNVGYGVTVKS